MMPKGIFKVLADLSKKINIQLKILGCNLCVNPIGVVTKMFFSLGIVIIIILASTFIIKNWEDINKPLYPTDSSKLINLKTDRFQGFNDEKNERARNTLLRCGIQQINSITRDSNLDEDILKAYRLTTEYDSTVFVYVDNDRIRWVRFLGNYLYKNSEVLAVASDYELLFDEQSNYQIRCKKIVESVLKAPSTAKFPNILKWNIFKQDGFVIVQSYVDSQNSFGAMLRSEFQFKIKNDKIISFVFDGEEYTTQE